MPSRMISLELSDSKSATILKYTLDTAKLYLMGEIMVTLGISLFCDNRIHMTWVICKEQRFLILLKAGKHKVEGLHQVRAFLLRLCMAEFK